MAEFNQIEVLQLWSVKEYRKGNQNPDQKMNKKSNTPQHKESSLQQACVYWFTLQYPGHRGLLFAVPNGGFRIAREAARLYAEGVVPGVSDLILLESRGPYGSLCIEMKTTDKSSRQSDRQKEWQHKAELMGNRYVICRTLDEFRAIVDEYMALPLNFSIPFREVDF